MSKYCPAGKCECEMFSMNWQRDPQCKLFTDFTSIQKFEVCPWPSRQVKVELPMQVSMPVELVREIERLKAQSAALRLIGADISKWLYPLALVEQIEKAWNKQLAASIGKEG